MVWFLIIAFFWLGSMAALVYGGVLLLRNPLAA